MVLGERLVRQGNEPPRPLLARQFHGADRHFAASMGSANDAKQPNQRPVTSAGPVSAFIDFQVVCESLP